MPRSFLVKKHFNAAKKPNYSELESPTGNRLFGLMNSETFKLFSVLQLFVKFMALCVAKTRTSSLLIFVFVHEDEIAYRIG